MFFSSLLLMKIFWTGMSGAFGAGTRHIISVNSHRHLGGHFPWGTFLINMTGSLVIGFLTALFIRYPALSSWHGPLILGFLGGYTTFSTFVLELARLRAKSAHFSMLTYLIVSVVIGPLVVFLGILLGKGI